MSCKGEDTLAAGTFNTASLQLPVGKCVHGVRLLLNRCRLQLSWPQVLLTGSHSMAEETRKLTWGRLSLLCICTASPAVAALLIL